MMCDTDILGGQADQRGHREPAEETLRLLTRWLLHCHEQARQRRQLGVLEPRLFDDISVIRSGVPVERETSFWQ